MYGSRKLCFAPNLAVAFDVRPDRMRTGRVTAGADRDDKPFDFIDATFQVKVSGKDTEGRCVIFDTVRHQKIGPALHIHTDCDEWFFVKAGDFKFKVGNEFLHQDQRTLNAAALFKQSCMPQQR